MPEPRVVLRKTSLVDYPPFISGVLFFPGCNLRCPWCHNRDLVLPAPGGGPPGSIGLSRALAGLEKRRGLLGGVVISGGEPTLYPALADLIARIREMGLKVKLDTNGLRPDVLEGLFAAPQTSPDYIALDLKTAPERYVELLPPEPAASPVPGGENRGRFAGGTPGAALRRSAALIRASGRAHEFRSLELPGGYFTAGDRAALAELAGDSPWKIRPFIPGGCLDPAWDRIA